MEWRMVKVWKWPRNQGVQKFGPPLKILWSFVVISQIFVDILQCLQKTAGERFPSQSPPVFLGSRTKMVSFKGDERLSHIRHADVVLDNQ